MIPEFTFFRALTLICIVIGAYYSIIHYLDNYDTLQGKIKNPAKLKLVILLYGQRS